MPRLKPRAFSCKIQKFFSLPIFYTRVFLEVTNLVLGNRKNAAHNWSLNLPTLYYLYTCYVVIMYLCDSDQFII